VGENTEVDVEIGPRGRGYLDKRYQRVTMGFGSHLTPLLCQF
jgi:lysine-specific demethylase 8